MSVYGLFVFFFKQKTAYEMLISDGSSDVCSSDLGRAYGVELYLKKQKGKLNGWLSYALAKSERQFEGINGGAWFAARQDRTHDVSAVGMYQLSPRWNLSATFVYSTGTAVTFPSGKYSVDGRTLWYYPDRNGYLLPDYQRPEHGH